MKAQVKVKQFISINPKTQELSHMDDSAFMTDSQSRPLVNEAQTNSELEEGESPNQLAPRPLRGEDANSENFEITPDDVKQELINMTKFGKKAGIPQEESIDRTPKGKPRLGKISVSPARKAQE
jgi:hypothetical protein